MTALCFLGVDPGLDGAIAVIHPDGGIDLNDVPTIGGSRRDYEISAMQQIVMPIVMRYGAGQTRACIEEVHARGGNGSIASFSLGESRGIYRTLFTFLGVSLERIPPERWKRAMAIPVKLGKDASRAKALELFPALHAELNLKKHHGRADALLLAEWRRRQG
jgi:hypothetical protein